MKNDTKKRLIYILLLLILGLNLLACNKDTIQAKPLHYTCHCIYNTSNTTQPSNKINITWCIERVKENKKMIQAIDNELI